jgi:hypothetical protein
MPPLPSSLRALLRTPAGRLDSPCTPDSPASAAIPAPRPDAIAILCPDPLPDDGCGIGKPGAGRTCGRIRAYANSPSTLTSGAFRYSPVPLNGSRAPLDGQQEKTRPYRIPVARRRKLASRWLASSARLHGTPQIGPCFFFGFVVLFILDRFLYLARQTFLPLFCFWRFGRLHPKFCKMNTPGRTGFLLPSSRTPQPT